MSTQIQASMLLVTFKAPGVSTFKLIPITKDCPYQEAFYVTSNKVLAIVGISERYQVSEGKKGEMVYSPKQLPVEYHITEKTEIVNFINMIAINSGTFDFNQYLETSEPRPTISMVK